MTTQNRKYQNVGLCMASIVHFALELELLLYMLYLRYKIIHTCDSFHCSLTFIFETVQRIFVTKFYILNKA